MWNDNYLLFQSALDGGRGPATFDTLHEKFLRLLWNVNPVHVDGKTVVSATAARWEKNVRSLGLEWQQLGQEVLRRATDSLQENSLRCGVMHGDFAPWNTRMRQNDLLLFDWESADWESPNGWDIFHFHVQSSLSLKKKIRFPKFQLYDEISFMLYVINAVCQFLEEENHVAICYYKQLLLTAFQGKQALWEG
jgi:hypothetical protein